MSGEIRDRRIERTRQALLGAFVQLMFEGRRYDRIRVQDLIERAGVGRSTFYEHYRSKDEVLAESIRHPFTPLADAVKVDADSGQLRAILVHFRENRVQARAIFGGSVRRRVSRILASMIEERLRGRARSNGVVAPAELDVAAVAIAEGQLAAIVAWSAGEIAQDEAQLAQVLLRIAQATAAAVCGEAR